MPAKSDGPTKYYRQTGERVTGLTDLYIVFEEVNELLQFNADDRPELPG
jgi:hypothetical protein